MKKACLMAVLGTSLLCSASLYAANGQNVNTNPFQNTKLSAGAGVGTLGPQVKASAAFNKYLGVSAGLSKFDYDHDFSAGVTSRFDSTYEIETVSLLANVFPFGGNFRVSGGAFYDGNKVTFKTHETQFDVSASKNQYSNSTLEGSIDFNTFAPYFGLGYGNGYNQTGFGFDADLGVLYQGTPSVTLKSTGTQAVSASDITAVKKKIQDDADKYKLYPVASIGVHYTF